MAERAVAISQAVAAGAFDTIENMATHLRHKLFGRRPVVAAPLHGKVGV